MSRINIERYYNEVDKIIQYGGSKKETAIRGAFQKLLNSYCESKDFILIPELDFKTPFGTTVHPDGTVKDVLRLDWGLLKFQEKYQDERISKESIFNYTYSVLHNPAYQKKYELNLKREFPRIPFYEDFWKWAKWGKELMDLHFDYESVKPYDLIVETKNDDKSPKLKLKPDKENNKIILDTHTVISGIPSSAWQYKLGNRSALEWILDQYKEKKPKDPTIREKFNAYKFADHKDQVIDLIKRVTTVSVKTVEIIREMEREKSE